MIRTGPDLTPARSAATTALSLLGFGVAWLVAARIAADPMVLPAPAEVWRIVVQETARGEMARHVSATLARVVAAFGLAMGLGLAIGIVLGLSPRADRWLGPWVQVFQNMPALVVIVLCYLWIGLNEIAAITAVALNKTAMVAITIREGVRGLDPKLDAMARVYRMGRGARLVHVVWPQLWPFVAAATRNGLAIIWKIVLVVEFLGRSSGVGFQIHLYFQLFETRYVLAYALCFVAVMLAIEHALVAPLDRRSRRWQRAARVTG